MVAVKHKFVSAELDEADPENVRPSNWNDDHDLTAAAAPRILGRVTAGPGAVEELTGAQVASMLDTVRYDVAQTLTGVQHQQARRNINIESVTGVGDIDYIVLLTDRVLEAITAFTAPRTWTLPDASTVNRGAQLWIYWGAGVLTTNPLTLVVAGGGGFRYPNSGAATSYVLSSPLIGCIGFIARGNANAWQVIQDSLIVNDRLANMAQATIKGRALAVGTGSPTDLTPQQAMDVLANTNANLSTIKWQTIRTFSAGDANSLTAGEFVLCAPAVLNQPTGNWNAILTFYPEVANNHVYQLAVDVTGAEGALYTRQKSIAGGSVWSAWRKVVDRVSTQNRILGRISAGAGNAEELTGAQVLAITGAAPIASPAFTGNPTAPTAAVTDNDTSLATTAFVKSVAQSAWGVRGLKGDPQSSTTIWLQFSEATLRSAAGDTHLFKSGSFNVNISAAVGNGGPDGTLTDGDVHFYAMWGLAVGDGSICSMSAPPTGPALPANYTHWCYLTTLKRSGGNLLQSPYVRGNKVFFTSMQGVLVNGTATSPTIATLVTYMPAIATAAFVSVQATLSTSGGGAAGSSCYVGIASGSIHVAIRVDLPGGNQNGSESVQVILPNINQAFYYYWSHIYGAANIANNNCNCWITGYEVPNGD